MPNNLKNLMVYETVKPKNSDSITGSIEPAKENIPIISPPDKNRFQSIVNFIYGLPKNIFLAIATTPFERLALARINQVLDKPNQNHTSYYLTMKTLGTKRLFAGVNARALYCLGGNFSTLFGICVFGDDLQGLFATTLFKNTIYPLYLWSNSRQRNYTSEETARNIFAGLKNPMGHFTFFCRNGLANFCLLPGTYVRDYTYQAWGEKDDRLPKALGLATTLAFSAAANALAKPLFTDIDKYPFKARWKAAKGLPGLGALAGREVASLLLIFGSTTAKKAQKVESDQAPVIASKLAVR